MSNPSSASRIAAARPTRRAAPVTNATPFSFVSLIGMMLTRKLRSSMYNPAPHLNASTLLTILAIALASQITLAQTNANKNIGPWSPDNGDGTYKNPIIFADYSDPDVIRVGDDFYLTASSFTSIPALPILHSK